MTLFKRRSHANDQLRLLEQIRAYMQRKPEALVRRDFPLGRFYVVSVDAAGRTEIRFHPTQRAQEQHFKQLSAQGIAAATSWLSPSRELDI